MKGDFDDVSWVEALGAFSMSAAVGIVHALYLVRQGRRFKWVDMFLEPLLAVMGGMGLWAIAETVGAPDLIQGLLTSLGAWGGPKTIHQLEVKYLGGSRKDDQLTKDTDYG